MERLSWRAVCILCLAPAAGVPRGAEERVSVDRATRGLPLIDTVDGDGRPLFSVRGYEDFRYTRPLKNAGSLENAGGPGKAEARFTTKDAADYTFYDLDGVVLCDGEAVAVTLTALGERDYAGLAVDDNVFILGRHANRGKHRDDGTNMNPFRTPDHMAYIAEVSRDLCPETVAIARSGDRIDWFACGRKGSYTIGGLGASPRLSLFAHGRATMGALRKGRPSRGDAARLRSCVPAPRHPYGRPNTPGFAGRRETMDHRRLAEALSPDLNARLSDAEVEALVRYVSSLNEPGFGSRVGPLFCLPGLYNPAKIFLITRRREVLDHLIRLSDPALIARNGFEVDGVRYGVRVGGEFNRCVNLHDYCPFPGGGFKSEADHRDPNAPYYFNERHEYVCNEISRSGDFANASMIAPSLAAYCISLHPETWDRRVPDGDPCGLGETYRRRGERYVKELALNYADYNDIKLYNFLPEPVWDSYADFYRDKRELAARLRTWEERRNAARQEGEEALAAFLEADPMPQPKERGAGINRFSAAVSCAGSAARAADAFGDAESMRTIDACAERFLRSWFNCFQFYAPGHDGEYLEEPDKWYRAWGYQPNCVSPDARDYDTSDCQPGRQRGVGEVRGEDIGHARFTSKGMYMLYESHRYEHIMTAERMGDLARTFNEIVIPTYDTWRPLPRASREQNLAPRKGIDTGIRQYPILMFADFNPELKRKIIRGLQESLYERTALMNRLILAEMRARKHGQIPTTIVE